MIYGLRPLITRRGNVVRSDIARPETVARYLARVEVARRLSGALLVAGAGQTGHG
jgi:hypothetical protein